ncbi:MAG TPA: hypothetical protein VF989_01720 [Polyangiaceae bacterium]|jgi:hypothetical protein
MTRRLVAACLVGLLLAGCFRAKVRSGLPPHRVAPSEDYAWHHGFLFGLIEASAAPDLERICASGWSEISTELDPLTAAATLVTLGLYSPQRVTVVCAPAHPSRAAALLPSGALEYPPEPAYPSPPLPRAP